MITKRHCRRRERVSAPSSNILRPRTGSAISARVEDRCGMFWSIGIWWPSNYDLNLLTWLHWSIESSPCWCAVETTMHLKEIWTNEVPIFSVSRWWEAERYFEVWCLWGCWPCTSPFLPEPAAAAAGDRVQYWALQWWFSPRTSGWWWFRMLSDGRYWLLIITNGW